MHLQRIPQRKMTPVKGPFLSTMHVVVVMVMVMMIVEHPSLCAGDRGDRERDGHDCGQNKTKRLHGHVS